MRTSVWAILISNVLIVSGSAGIKLAACCDNATGKLMYRTELPIRKWPKPTELYDNVTLMITVIESDVDKLALRIPHLVQAQGVRFHKRLFIIDLKGETSTPSDKLTTAMRQLIKDDYMDDWAVVNYDRDYVSNLIRKYGVFKPRTKSKGHQQGNLAYWVMPDLCETRYLLHFDSDVLMYTRPGYSWISQSIRAIEAADPAENTFIAYPNAVIFRESNPGGVYRYLKKACGQQYYAELKMDLMTSRHFLMDVKKFEELQNRMRAANLFSNHFETTMTLNACNANFTGIRVDTSCDHFILHAPRIANEQTTEILDKYISRGIAYLRGGQTQETVDAGYWGLASETEESVCKHNVLGQGPDVSWSIGPDGTPKLRPGKSVLMT